MIIIRTVNDREFLLEPVEEKLVATSQRSFKAINTENFRPSRVMTAQIISFEEVAANDVLQSKYANLLGIQDTRA